MDSLDLRSFSASLVSTAIWTQGGRFQSNRDSEGRKSPTKNDTPEKVLKVGEGYGEGYGEGEGEEKAIGGGGGLDHAPACWQL